MIGYTTIGSNNLARAEAYYDALFEAVGIKRLGSFGARGTAWGPGWDKPCFAVMTPFDNEQATPGNGNMVALVYKEPAQVDALYAKALALGSKDEGAPGPRGTSGFYGAYFRDLDDNKLCAFCMVRA
jgi:catechol 2,3-dioxygenase-like lactoylglutathione lyase family enzyme